MSTRDSLRISRARSEDIVDHLHLAETSAAIIGVGAIGSNAAYLLAKLGVGKLHIYDYDKVEEENIEPQFYTSADIGRMKVSAIRDIIQSAVPDVVVTTNRTRFSASTNMRPYTHRYVVSGVDSIESRIDIADALTGQRRRWTHYLDARMGGNIVELWHVTSETIEEYRELLVNAEPLNIPCSARATSYNGMLVASLVAREIAAISKGQPVPARLHIDLLGWGFNMSGLQDTLAVL